MKKILFTGGSGFLGRNLVPELKKKYYVLSPRRTELNLIDNNQVKDYLKNQKFDVVIHAAIPNYITNNSDKKYNICGDSLRAYCNLYNNSDLFGKMIYFGSGAEFDKTRNICSVNEDEFGNEVPKDGYGLAKFIMNELCRTSKNIYNLRIFGCYGPTDANFKFLTHIINCCLGKGKVIMNQDCYFDYIYVLDLVNIIEKIIESNPNYHDYNVCSGQRYKLSDIAKRIMLELNVDEGNLLIKNKNMNNEYTATNKRLMSEYNDIKFTSISEGIKLQIEYEKWSQYGEKKSC